MKPLYRLLLTAGAAALSATAVAASGAPAAAPATAAHPASRITQIMRRLRDVRKFSAVAVSPDGHEVAWVVSRSRGTPSAANAAGSATSGGAAHAEKGAGNAAKKGQLLQVASVDGGHVRTVMIPHAVKSCRFSDPRWSPDGRSLAFLSNCNHPEKKSGQFDIFIVGPRAETAERISQLDGHVHALRWTSNGKALSFLYVKGDLHPIGAVTATKPRVGVIGRSGVEHQRLAVIPASGGTVREITPESLFVYEYDWAPAAKRLVYVAAPPPGRDNWWTAKLYTQVPGAIPKVIVDPSSVTGSLRGLQIALPRWSPDGSYIAFIGGLMSDQGVTGGDIYLVGANGGTPVNLTRDIGITPSWLMWTGTRSLLVSSFAGGSTRLSRFVLHGHSPATSNTLFTVHSAISDGSAMSSVSVSKGHDKVAFIDSTFDSPPAIDVATLGTGASDGPTGAVKPPHAITKLNDGVKSMWGKAVSMHWTNDGFHVQGWLLFPPDYNPHRRYPLIVYVHGGPTYATRPRWPDDGYGPVPLAAMGYFVLMPNPRGSFGQGERFTQAVRRDMGYGDLRDILAGVDAVEAHYPIDDKRLGITGWSYGGFMSMFAPTQTRRFKAAVVGAGLSDWRSYYGENSIDQWMIPFFGASVYQDPKVYAKSSAIDFITHDKAPSLILVGQYDGECPAPQSFEFWHALRAMEVPTTLVVYAGEGHGFHKHKDRRDVLRRSLRWFQHYLGNQRRGTD